LNVIKNILENVVRYDIENNNGKNVAEGPGTNSRTRGKQKDQRKTEGSEENSGV